MRHLLKPTGYHEVVFKYSCPKCYFTHLFNLSEVNIPGYRQRCHCGYIMKFAAVSNVSIKCRYKVPKKKPQLTSTQEQVKQTLQAYGYTAGEICGLLKQVHIPDGITTEDAVKLVLQEIET